MTFRDIYGHTGQIAQLKAALVQDRLPHALLFYGMEGIGKRTTALVFAKAANCRGGDGGDACDACPSCRKADHQNHLDIITLTPDGQFIKIQAVRDLQERLKFKPWEGKKRVTIIDEAERLHDAAANALLKTLEEPPAGNVIVLVSARPAQLPATILSRCRQVRFNPLSEETVVSFLREKRSLDDPAAHLLASSSGGSIARALALQSSDYAETRTALMDILAEGQMRDPLSRLSQVRQFGNDREAVLDRLSILRHCYRDALVYKESGSTMTLINRDRPEALTPLAERLSTVDIIDNIRTIDAAYRAVEQHADRALTLEVMMFRLK